MKRLLLVRETDGSCTILAEQGVKARVFYAEGDAAPAEYIHRVAVETMDAALPQTKGSKAPPKKIAMPSVPEMAGALTAVTNAMEAAPTPRKDRSRIKPGVSDHARIRYLMRHRGLDIDALDAEIMPPRIQTAIRAGVASINVNGLRYIISDDNTIITIVEPRDLPRASPRDAGRPKPKHRRDRDEIAEYFSDLAKEAVG